MARIAVLSDIHANIFALERVLADLRARGIDRTVCLGDVVGYGPDPKECLDLALGACDVVIAGNHERAVLQPSLAAGWVPLAQAGLDHTRAELAPSDIAAIAAMPATFTFGDQVLGVHDSPVPNDKGMHYLRGKSDAVHAFHWLEHAVGLVGHTHVPACFATTLDHDDVVTSRDIDLFPIARRMLGATQEFRGSFVGSAEFELPRFGRAIVNPGSVGQPRDGDARAAYAILDLEAFTIEFRRVAYDVARARARFEETGLPVAAGERLALGA
jgi:predicted phosphodiesterase